MKYKFGKCGMIYAILCTSLVVSLSGCGSTEKMNDTAVSSVESGGDTAGASDGKGADPGLKGAVSEGINSVEGGAFEEAEAADDGLGAGFDMTPADAAAGESLTKADTPAEMMPPEEVIEMPDEDFSDILTAGRWSDNDNWGFFANLVNNGKIKFPSFGIDPRKRAEIVLRDAAGKPVKYTEIEALKGTEIIWTAYSDQNGKGYIFYEDKAPEKVKVGNKTYDINVSPADSEGEQSQNKVPVDSIGVNADVSADIPKGTSVMFILDTTGSMGDEMLYLQSDFASIAEEIGNDDTNYCVSFYKDSGDEYVTRVNQFTSNVPEIQSLLNSEYASGGGDTPEAVADILKEAITDNSEWDSDRVNLAFLIFDAPPHDGTEDTLKEAIKAAAKKGVRLIPVVSSNSERDTELFGRAIAICTGGEYVFLTDDSGVGNSHLEPIIGDYEVKSLHEHIVDIVREYRGEA